jgi:acyltransferase
VRCASSRHDWVNTMRAIGILLVVLGHTLGISEGLENFIFSFHMPLFFFLSGLVLTESRLVQGYLSAAQHYARRLLLPYFIFSFITWLPWVFATRHYGADAVLGVPAWKPLIGTLYGIGVDGWLQHNAMLWFFPCLFVLHVFFRLLVNSLNGSWLVIGIVASASLGLGLAGNLPSRLPWGIEIALLALPFYAAGYVFSRKVDWFPQRGLYLALMVVMFALVQFACIALNGRVDMNFISIGNPFLFYVGAFAGIGTLAGLAVFLPLYPLSVRVAEAAVLAFPLHRLLFSVFSALGMFLFVDFQAFKTSPWGSVAYAVGAVGVSVAIFPWVRRYLPALVGGR